MQSEVTHVVIVGGGHAAGQLAASLRQEKFEGAITIIGDEPHPPYQRPPLSKAYLSGEQEIERVYLRPEKFYADRDIELLTGVTATAIDRDAKTVTTDDGRTLNWDHLVLATGSRVRKLPLPGADLDGVHYLRTVMDVDGIRAAMETAKSMVVVGGGYIGLEVAAVARESGIAVTVLEMESRILQRVATEAMSTYYHQVHTGHGVDIRTNIRATGFVGTDGKVTAVDCEGEHIAADLVIVGVGVLPNIELAEAAGLPCENGITVDDHCRTADPSIFAIGDCCNHPSTFTGGRLRLESVPNAMEQARVVAANVVGKDKVYESVPWFWSDQYDLKLQMVGFPASADTHVTRGSLDENEFITFYLRDGVVIAADAVNDPKSFMAARKLAESARAVDANALGDVAIDLKDI